ncbi:unnamed protein product [Urochloa humidicola]
MVHMDLVIPMVTLTKRLPPTTSRTARKMSGTHLFRLQFRGHGSHLPRPHQILSGPKDLQHVCTQHQKKLPARHYSTFAQNIPKLDNQIFGRCPTARSSFRITREHSYVDVVVQTRSGKAVRVVVELSFRAEFEVARAGAEYRALVAALPEVFVGRADRLRGVVKAMCAAAKQCMKENNMHMGPWRKHKYMQAKWLGTPERTAAVAAAAAKATPVVVVPAVTAGSPEKPTKFRASMLTFDFGRTAVEVV